MEDVTADVAQAYIDREWPRHEAHLGHDWNPVDLRIGARVDGTLVGIASFTVNGGLCELKHLLVGLDSARRGVGTALLAAVEARARSLGSHKIRLETAEYQARPFYERNGYRCACTLEDDRFRRTWYVMEKRLG
jgi:GNAT superfamily N-acetyltransferase